MLNYFYHVERVISNVGVVVGHFDSPLFTQPNIWTKISTLILSGVNDSMPQLANKVQTL